MDIHARNKEWVRRVLDGDTLQEVADDYGVTKQRVSQVMLKLGVKSPFRPGAGAEKLPSIRDARRIWSVYVMAAPHGEATFLKVGISSNLPGRLDSMQTACPIPITRVWAITAFSNGAAQVIEREMHKMLSAIRSQGEWFVADVTSAEHKVLVNSAFRFAVEKCSHGKENRWRTFSVAELREALRAVGQEHRAQPKRKRSPEVALDLAELFRKKAA